MKVTSMYPVIVSDNPEKTMEFYETLGFTKKHELTTGMGSRVYIIANGDFEIELMEAVNEGPYIYPAGLYGFRMNVGDIDEAVETFKQNGGTILAGPIDAATSKMLIVTDADGINITLMQHIK